MLLVGRDNKNQHGHEIINDLRKGIHPCGVRLATEWYIRATFDVESPSWLILCPSWATDMYRDGVKLRCLVLEERT